RDAVQLLLAAGSVAPGEGGGGAKLAALADVEAFRQVGGVEPLLARGAEPRERAPDLGGEVETEVEVFGLADRVEVVAGAETVLEQLDAVVRGGEGEILGDFAHRRLAGDGL